MPVQLLTAGQSPAAWTVQHYILRWCDCCQGFVRNADLRGCAWQLERRVEARTVCGLCGLTVQS
jgi:hypothetical protein